MSTEKLQMLRNLHMFAEFQNFQLDNLVDFEKCRKTVKASLHHSAERVNGRSYDPIRKGLEQKTRVLAMPAVPKDEPKTFNVSTVSKAI